MDTEFMRKKPILPLVMSMSLPMVLSMLVNSLYNIVDSFFVAKISDGAMTALSLVFPVQNLINAVAIGFGVGVNAAVSFYLGAKEYEKADGAAARGLLLSVIHGLIGTAVGIFGTSAFLPLFTSDESVISLGKSYSTVVFAFAVIINVGLVFEKIFQSAGKMNVTMIGLSAGCIANIVLDPVLIFGWGPFPKMGIEGAALATGIGQTVSLAVYLIVYFARPLCVKIRKKHFRPEKRTIGKLYSVGIPATLNLALPSVLISALNAILAAYSGVYILVLGIYYKLQTFLYLPANGFVQGMRPLVGYNYGAGEKERVRKIFMTVLCLCGVIMAVGTVVCLLIPETLIGLFTPSAETVKAGGTALRIISGGFIVSAVSVTASGALEGLGKGLPSLVISLCRNIVVIIPAAFILSKIFGADGVWHAFWVTETFSAAVSLFVYKKSTHRAA